MNKHSYKVHTGTGWVNFDSLDSGAKNEAMGKGLVEHDEWCACNDAVMAAVGAPPF